MSKPLAVVLTSIAFLLSSVTAISVALAIYSLIEDKKLALIFSSAAVLLDIFKYLAWPVAVRLLSGTKAFLMIACAMILSVVSGWSTYDRLMSSISLSKSTHDAMTSERVHALKQLVQRNSDLLTQIEQETSDASKQASELRIRGMVSKALELESFAATRASTQRSEAIARINSASLEIAQITASVPKASTLPALLAQLLCLGFAMSLEIVPALILSTVRGSKAVVQQDEQLKELQKPLETPETLLGTNAEILETLLALTRNAQPGTPVKLKDFAKQCRIGNLRAGEIFRSAENLGVIKKTTVGYVVTG